MNILSGVKIAYVNFWKDTDNDKYYQNLSNNS